MEIQINQLVGALDTLRLFDGDSERLELIVEKNLYDLIHSINSTLNTPYGILTDKLSSIINSGFVQNIVYTYIQACLCKQLKERVTKDDNSCRGKQIFNEENNLLWNQRSFSILKSTMELIATICERTPSNIEQLEQVIDRIGLILNVLDDDSLTDFFTSTILQHKMNYTKREKMFGQTQSCQKPPENFRKMPLIPKLSEIKSTRNLFLRPNLKHGSFIDVEHYLDIHFRLLREDYVGSLREGLTEYLAVNEVTEKENKKTNLSNLMNIQVYKKVKILESVTDNQNIIHMVQFEITNRMHRIRWETSKRLIVGSLLCFTNDNFKTAFFATVFDRDARELYDGKVLVKFDDWIGINNNILLNDFNNSFTMVETLAYFESYRHTLDSLKLFNEKNFPFKKHIVYSQNGSIDHAKYLRERVQVYYDFRPLIKNAYKIEVLKEIKGFMMERENILVPDEIIKQYVFNNSMFSSINVMESQFWPSSSLMGLDDSQYRALHSALKEELVVIQGPPGTGK
jgi:hypothetical protein